MLGRIVLLLIGSTLPVCYGHGRLMDPPARNAMWRFGYPNPVNYNDNELFCGGFAVQWQQNSGKCGVCGDAYHLKSPRPHEAGGEFAKGIISRYYASGQVHIFIIFPTHLSLLILVLFFRKSKWKSSLQQTIMDDLKCSCVQITMQDTKLLKIASIGIHSTYLELGNIDS